MADKASKGNDISPPSYNDPESSSSRIHPEKKLPPSEYSIFPRDIVIYRTTYISLIIGPQYEGKKPQPPPLFYVSVHMDNRFTNKSVTPQIRLHYGPDDTYPVIGSSRFRMTPISDITIKLEKSASETKTELAKVGALASDSQTFYHTVKSKDGKAVREKFVWKHSGDPEVKALATENEGNENITQEDRGLKLVRDSTGEMIAVFCGGKHSKTLNPRRVAGKVRFVPRQRDFGEEGEEVWGGEMKLLAVMSILTIMERGRRNATYNASKLFDGACVVC